MTVLPSSAGIPGRPTVLLPSGHLRNAPALASVALLVGALSISQKVMGSVPGQSTCLGCGFNLRSRSVREATSQCFSLTLTFLSLPLFLPLSLKTMKKKYIFG